MPVAPSQVVEDLDWGADPYQGCVLVPLAVPEQVSQVTALLRCRVKLVSPGVNGDTEYQNFEETKRWVGKQCLLACAVHASGTCCTMQAHRHIGPLHTLQSGWDGCALQCGCAHEGDLLLSHALPWLDPLQPFCVGYQP